jgi:flagellar biosynthesis/type III secretory pathway chaperone
MDQLLDSLTTILENEVQLHDDLIRSAGNINKTIRESDLDGLQKNTTQYDEQICVLEKLEEKRLEHCRQLGRNAGMEEERIRQAVPLNALMEHLPQENRLKLETIRAHLRSKMQELSKVNTSNKILIEESLSAITSTFSIIRKSAERFAGYGQKGNMAVKKTGCALINKIA